VKTRTIDEIEKAFRDMGLSEATWGREALPALAVDTEQGPTEQVFIRIEGTTTPLKAKRNAHMAQPPK